MTGPKDGDIGCVRTGLRSHFPGHGAAIISGSLVSQSNSPGRRGCHGNNCVRPSNGQRINPEHHGVHGRENTNGAPPKRDGTGTTLTMLVSGRELAGTFHDLRDCLQGSEK
jgi:hypothetical protein